MTRAASLLHEGQLALPFDANGRPGPAPPEIDIRSVSIGGGVQSTVLALLADRGSFGARPDIGLWADTGWDPPHVQEMVEWLTGQVSFPVERVRATRAASLAAHTSAAGSFYLIPAHLTAPDGKQLLAHRRCTAVFKLDPLHRRLKQLVGPRGRAEAWLGITVEEMHRMKQSTVEWCPTRWPLIEVNMTRRDCLAWWEENAPAGAPALRRSACVGCPFHTTEEWAELGRLNAAEIAAAAQVEADLQAKVRAERPGAPIPWLHRRRVPLAEAVSADMQLVAARGEQQPIGSESHWDAAADDLWAAECDGVCRT